jgi:hypothetical protein
MINVMLMLGLFRFSVSTAGYQALTRSKDYRWQAQERYGQLPAQQYTGPGAESITLTGDIYPSFNGGLHQIDLMRYQANIGKPLMLVDGSGYVYGRWVILSIEENQETFFANGVARKQSFAITITRYGDLT